jgi:Holliday junction DNA helicase RuvA subunit
MITHLTGELARLGDRWVVVDVRGVGYLVHVPAPFALHLRGVKGPVTIHTHLVMKEDGATLYGFSGLPDLELFRLLIGVAGIGPQTALSILSSMGPREFAAAVIGDDERALTRCQGVGPKSAKRLILELKDRCREIQPMLPGPDGHAGEIQDAVDALVALGFSAKDSRDAVDAEVPEHGAETSERLVKAALVRLRGRSHG